MLLIKLFLFILMLTFREVAYFQERLRDVVIACLTLGPKYCVMLGAVCMHTIRIVDFVKASKQCLGL